MDEFDKKAEELFDAHEKQFGRIEAGPEHLIEAIAKALRAANLEGRINKAIEMQDPKNQ